MLTKKITSVLLITIYLIFSLPTLAQDSTTKSSPNTITVAVLNDFPPLYSRDKSGNQTGFAIDILKHVAKQNDLVIKYFPTENWAQAMQAVRTGKADLIPGIGISPVRSAEFLFTEKIETIPVSCFVRTSNQSIKGIMSLPGHRVAVIGKSAAETQLKSMPGVKLVPFENIQSALFQLLTGDVDAFVFPEPVLKKKMQLMRIGSDHIKVVGKPLMELKRGFLLHKSDEQLVKKLNPTIKAYTQSNQYLADYQQWYGKPEAFWTVQRVFWLMFFLLTLLLVTFFIWRFYSLRKLNLHLMQTMDELETAYQSLKKVELQKAREHALLGSMFDSIPDLIFYKDSNGVYMGCNRAFEAFVGYQESEIIGLTDLDIFPNELTRAFQEKDHQMLNSDKTQSNEEWVTYPDGQRILLNTLKTPYLSPDGETLGLIGISRDITANRETEQALDKSEQEWTQAMDFFEDAIYLIDLNDRLVRANQAFYTMTGLTSEQAIGMNIATIIHPQGEEVPCPVCAARLEQRDEFISMEPDHPDNPTGLPIEIMVRIIRDKKQSPLGILMGIHDLTRTRQAQKALEESEARYRTIFDGAPEGIWLLDAALKTIEVNHRLCEILGYQLNEIVGKKPLDFADDENKIIFQTQTEKIGSSETCNYEIQLQHKDGNNVPVYFNTITLHQDNNKNLAAVAFVTDLTEQKIAENALRRAQKMDAIGQLTGGIAHDFNNLLGIIIGNLDFLKHMLTSDDLSVEKAEKRVDSVSKAALRAADLTKQLLGFSRKQAQDSHPTDINEVIRNMDNLIARSVTPEVEVELLLDNTLWLTNIDSGDLEDALLNLIINARDGMPMGGKLTIETSNVTLDDDYARLNPDFTPGEYLQLIVSDSGIGIAKDELEQIFEPFYTTKPLNKGTGLGLSMVYGFTKRSKGYIKVYSELGVGTTFRLYLPRAIEQRNPSRKEAHTDTSSLQGNETILVVDDEAELLELAKDSLTSCGYQIYTATRADEALAILDSVKTIDMLFTDVVMPGGMNGYDLAEQACKQNHSLKILLTSGFTKKTVTKNGPARFSSNLLSKPYNHNDMLKQVRKILDESQEVNT